jgi:hypothetical protein
VLLGKPLPGNFLKKKKKCSFDLTQTDKPTNYFFSQDPPFSRGNKTHDKLQLIESKESIDAK